MSRPIRYRAWDKKSKEYRTVKNIAFDYNGDIDFVVTVDKDTGQDPWDQTLDEIVLEQDTGLKDKNGKNICENDIVRLYDRYVSAITWQDDYCGFRWYNEVDGYCGLGKDNEEYYEVVGTIHENPELLEGKNE